LTASTSEPFDIPVALFLFKRSSTLKRIFAVLAQVRPSKLYLVADAARHDDEQAAVDETRRLAESLVTWPCEVVRDYAVENRGVHENIGSGALRVFAQEDRAIFLEDDNLPEASFFPFCQAMLDRYRDDPSVLWVCGTNYFGEQVHPDGLSYVFTQHLLPCGWASWADKFVPAYDRELKTLGPQTERIFKDSYRDKRLWRQQRHSVGVTKTFLRDDPGRASWDYQMLFSLRSQGRFGIVPMRNQIRNIGVDALSTHGGTSYDHEMTRRFCSMPSHPMVPPYVGPDQPKIDPKVEDALGRVLLRPMRDRLMSRGASVVKWLLRIDQDQSLATILRDRGK